MKRTGHKFLLAIVVGALLLTMPGIVWSQGGDDDPLDPVVVALLAQIEAGYNTTATQTAYQINIEEERTLFAAVRQFASGTYLMDVDIFDSYVSTQTTTTETSASFNDAETYLLTISSELEQQQGIGVEYVRDGTILEQPEDVEDQLEFKYAAIAIDGATFINTDETGCEFRVDVPEGWRVLAAETPVLEDVTFDENALDDVVNGVSLSTIAASATQLLDASLITGIELQETVELDNELANRYLITFDGTAALDELGVDVEMLLTDLEAAAGATLTSPTTTLDVQYALNVLMGASTGLVYEQTTTLTLQSNFAAGDGSSAAYSITQVNEVVVSEYDITTDISAPELGVIDPDETCALE